RPDTNGVIPEPSTWILLGSGLFGMGLRRRFKKQ
ncbi:MAG: PEP-CTERM sorting domain-containing protein, partial [Candidatus Zixiibacteriota bacterium]